MIIRERRVTAERKLALATGPERSTAAIRPGTLYIENQPGSPNASLVRAKAA